MSQPLLLTGHTGFIGMDFVQVLEDSRAPYVLLGSRVPNPSGKYCLGSISRRELEESSPQDLARSLGTWDFGSFVHLGWMGLPDFAAELCLANFYFSTRVFLAAKLAKIPRLVGVGSCFEYGQAVGVLTEDTKPVDPSFFARTKSLIADFLTLIGDDQSVSTAWARPFWIYGPNQRRGSLIPATLDALRSNSGWYPNTPDSHIDFVHVRDVSIGLKLLAEKPEVTGTVNLGTGATARVGDVVDFLSEVWLGTTPSALKIIRGGHDPRASVIRATEELGWEPTISLEDGLMQVLNAEK